MIICLDSYLILQWGRSPGKGRDAVPDLGQITYQTNGTKRIISFHAKDTDLRVPPDVGDKVILFKWFQMLI